MSLMAASFKCLEEYMRRGQSGHDNSAEYLPPYIFSSGTKKYEELSVVSPSYIPQKEEMKMFVTL